MKVFVTGVNGQLGHDVMNELAGRHIEAVGCGTSPVYKGIRNGSPVEKMPYIQLDITKKDQVNEAMEKVHPDAVIHCAAWTAVDAAEEPENIAKVRAVNVDGTRFIAEVCKKLGAKMLSMCMARVSLTENSRYLPCWISTLSSVLPGSLALMEIIS